MSCIVAIAEQRVTRERQVRVGCLLDRHLLVYAVTIHLWEALGHGIIAIPYISLSEGGYFPITEANGRD